MVFTKHAGLNRVELLRTGGFPLRVRTMGAEAAPGYSTAIEGACLTQGVSGPLLAPVDRQMMGCTAEGHRGVLGGEGGKEGRRGSGSLRRRGVRAMGMALCLANAKLGPRGSLLPHLPPQSLRGSSASHDFGRPLKIGG